MKIPTIKEVEEADVAQLLKWRTETWSDGWLTWTKEKENIWNHVNSRLTELGVLPYLTSSLTTTTII